MRSSKSRSRSKANRPRTLGNIINRVFDSSGPEGKVRGTPQQIIEKYQILARDAQLSNDRVAAENFLQHAEHYTRMLGEAQREMAAEMEARGQQGQQGQPQGNQRRDDRGEWQQNGQGGYQNGNGNGGNGNGGNGYRNDRDQRGEERRDGRNEGRQDYREGRQDYRDNRPAPQPVATEVIDLRDDGDAGLVETPEARVEAQPTAVVEPVVAEPVVSEPEAAVEAEPAEAKERAPRRPRGPRKPRAPKEEGGAPSDDAGTQAAE